jgi:hypothetical protein
VQIAGAGLDSRYRSLILAFAYALATGVAYFMLAPLLGLAALRTWSGAAHGGPVGVEVDGGYVGVRALAVLAVAGLVVAVAFVPWRRHTTPPA